MSSFIGKGTCPTCRLGGYSSRGSGKNIAHQDRNS